MLTPTITHVIFDMDGLLLDTERIYTLLNGKILERYGKIFDWPLQAKMMGKRTMESAQICVNESGLSGILSPEAFLKEREGMLQELLPTCSLLPGVERLVNHLHAKGIPMCVATASCTSHFLLKTQNHSKIFKMMHHIVKGDDPEVKQGKPAPDIFLAALRRFEGIVEASNCLVFEDAPYGIAAAKYAGMLAVMVPDPRPDISYHEGADQVISSLLQFSPQNWGLPPFQD
ncbi:(DL)-glycerol-3-phosphatase 2-like [Carex rostrata]